MVTHYLTVLVCFVVVSFNAYLRSEANAELTIKLHRVVMVTVKWCREASVVGLVVWWPVLPTLLDASETEKNGW